MIYPFKKTVFNCSQATLLSLKKEEGKITLTEHVKLSYHLLYCGVCREFIRQSHVINKIGKGMGKALLHTPPFSLTKERKQSLREQIELLNR